MTLIYVGVDGEMEVNFPKSSKETLLVVCFCPPPFFAGWLGRQSCADICTNFVSAASIEPRSSPAHPPTWLLP